MIPSFPLMTAHSNLFKGKRVLLRLDLNVPLLMDEIRSDFRIKTALPTINFLRQMGAKVIILAHLDNGKETPSLKPIANYLSKTMPLIFLDKLLSDENKEVIDRMNDGDICMLENLRMTDGEKNNSPEFVDYLALLGDYYINDAFAVSHRTHASIVGIAERLPSFAGMRLAEEAAELSRAFEPTHPYLFIMGGSKIKTKISLLKELGAEADHVFLGGVIANNFLKAKGYDIGESVCDDDCLPEVKELLQNERYVLPVDVIVKGGSGIRVSSVDDIHEHESIVDVGPVTISTLEKIVGESKFVIWNGPLGLYEDGYSDASRELIERISGSNAYTIIGGGDTVALIESMKKSSRFGFVSTGGGAMLEYLTNKTLPGIEVLKGIN